MSFRIVIRHNAPEIATQLAKLVPAVVREVDGAMGRGAAELTREARERAPKNTSQLTNRIQPQRVRALEHHVVAAAEHASHQEFGTKPGGRPSLARTLDWMTRAGITPRTPGMSKRSLAQLIRRKIARTGVPEQAFMRPALSAKSARLAQLMRAGAQRAVTQIQQGGG